MLDKLHDGAALLALMLILLAGAALSVFGEKPVQDTEPYIPPLEIATIAPEPVEYLPELTAANETEFGWTLDPRPTPEPFPVPQDEVDELALMLSYETIRGRTSETIAVCWVALGRVERSGRSLLRILRAEDQFAYTKAKPHKVDEWYVEIATGVLNNYYGNAGYDDYARNIGEDYLYFTALGDDVHNLFGTTYPVRSGIIFD